MFQVSAHIGQQSQKTCTKGQMPTEVEGVCKNHLMDEEVNLEECCLHFPLKDVCFMVFPAALIYSDKHLYCPPNWHMFDASLTQNESLFMEMKLASMRLSTCNVNSVLLSMKLHYISLPDKDICYVFLSRNHQ